MTALNITYNPADSNRFFLKSMMVLWTKPTEFVNQIVSESWANHHIPAAAGWRLTGSLWPPCCRADCGAPPAVRTRAQTSSEHPIVVKQSKVSSQVSNMIHLPNKCITINCDVLSLNRSLTYGLKVSYLHTGILTAKISTFLKNLFTSLNTSSQLALRSSRYYLFAHW